MHVIDALGRLKVTGGSSTLEIMGNWESGASWRVAGANFQFYDVTTPGWRTIWLHGAAGSEYFVLGDIDTNAADPGFMENNLTGANYRVSAGNFQLYNLDQSLWQTIYMVGATGVEQWAFGSGEA